MQRQTTPEATSHQECTSLTTSSFPRIQIQPWIDRRDLEVTTLMMLISGGTKVQSRAKTENKISTTATQRHILIHLHLWDSPEPRCVSRSSWQVLVDKPQDPSSSSLHPHSQVAKSKLPFISPSDLPHIPILPSSYQVLPPQLSTHCLSQIESCMERIVKSKEKVSLLLINFVQVKCY